MNINIKKKAIKSRIFLKIKSDGRAKGRLVAGGNNQDKTIYDDLSSATVSINNLFSVCTISAYEKRRIVTHTRGLIRFTDLYIFTEILQKNVIFTIF